MLRNFALGGLALIGGGITGIAISSWATPTLPPVAPEVVRVASNVDPSMLAAAAPRAANEASNCSPWEVSDVAMEAALDEMIRRGWRPPSQAEVVADGYSGSIQAVEPGSAVPVRNYWSSAPAFSEEDGSATDSLDQVQSTSEGALSPAPAAPVLMPPPTPIPTPAPALAIEEPTPPSN